MQYLSREDEIDRLNTHVNELLEKNAILTEKYLSFQSQAQKTLSLISKERDSLLNTNNLLEGQLKTKKTIIKALESERKRLENEVKNGELVNRKLFLEKEELEEALSRKMEGGEGSKEGSKEEFSRRELREILSKNQDLKYKMREIQLKLEDLELEEKQGKKEFEREVEKRKRKKQVYKQECLQLREENKELKQQLENLVTTYEIMEKDLQEMALQLQKKEDCEENAENLVSAEIEENPDESEKNEDFIE